MTAAEAFVEFARWWLLLGAAVAAIFLTVGIDRIDEDSRGAFAFRPLLIPGILLIWPLVLWRWMRLEAQLDSWAARYKPPRTIHLPVSIVLAAALGCAIVSGLAVRQTWPADIVPERLGEVEQ